MMSAIIVTALMKRLKNNESTMFNVKAKLRKKVMPHRTKKPINAKTVKTTTFIVVPTVNFFSVT